MSRWAYANVSFRDPDEETADEETEISPTLTAVPVTEGSVEPDAGYDVRVYYYHAGSASILSDSPDDDPVSVSAGASGTEEITEIVSLSWGEGTTQYPDLDGSTAVSDSNYKPDPVEFKTVTYTTRYKDFTLSSSTVGNHQAAVYFGDKSAAATISFTVEADTGSPYLSAVLKTDDPLVPTVNIPIRLYRYSPSDPVSSIIRYTPDSEIAWLTVTGDGDGTETITEQVALTFGYGSTSMPDLTGNQDVHDATYDDTPLAYKTVSYDIAYTDYTVEASEAGSYTVLFYYDDRSVTATLQLSVAEAEDAYQDSGSVYLSAVRQTTGNPEPGESFVVRLYTYHKDDVALESDSPDSGVGASIGGATTESITETVTLTWGEGNTSRPNMAGDTAVSDVAHSGDPVAYKTVTYSAPYRDATVSAAAVGDYVVAFYYADQSAVQTVSFTVEEADTPPVAEYKDVTVRSINYYSSAGVSGDSVYLGGSYSGTTDSDGYYTFSQLEVGKSYEVAFRRAGYKDSDLDGLENDTFTVTA